MTRVYDEVLASKGVPARVKDVVEDKKRGLVARLSGRTASDEAVVAQIMGEFAGYWEWAD